MIGRWTQAAVAAVALAGSAALGGAFFGDELRPARASTQAPAPGTYFVTATDSDSGLQVVDMTKVLYIRREANRTLITLQSAPPTQIYIREQPDELR